MQVRIARNLNRLLILFTAVVVIFFGGIFAASRFFPEYTRWHVLVFAVVSIGLAIVYRYLEENWDKRIILQMAKNNKVALMNIKGGKLLTAVRNTSFRTCWIYELEGELFNKEHEVLHKSFREKMNRETKEIPSGSVYVTYDELTPERIFIIPNAIIGSLPDLMPLVQEYEKDKKIKIRYLDAYYHRGMVLRTFKETMADYKKGLEEKKKKQDNGTEET
ncbi:MAG: hypothetical protein LBQ88_12505 [Treponema sp.]|jgi:hypothetical protein|nr:hypothetical protein [Treponema sp.]